MPTSHLQCVQPQIFLQARLSPRGQSGAWWWGGCGGALLALINMCHPDSVSAAATTSTTTITETTSMTGELGRLSQRGFLWGRQHREATAPGMGHKVGRTQALAVASNVWAWQGLGWGCFGSCFTLCIPPAGSSSTGAECPQCLGWSQ